VISPIIANLYLHHVLDQAVSFTDGPREARIAPLSANPTFEEPDALIAHVRI
jgi:hypothetical protein